MAKEDLRNLITPKQAKAARARSRVKRATAPIIQEDDSSRDKDDIEIYDKDDDVNQDGSRASDSYTEVLSMVLMGDSCRDPIKASLVSASGPRKTSPCSAGDPLKVAICSDVPACDSFDCPGDTAERDEHCMRSAYGLSESDVGDTMVPMYCPPLSATLGKTIDSWKTSSFKSHMSGVEAAASFGSSKSNRVGAEGTVVPFFRPAVADFDNLTSLGARAEEDVNHLRQCGLTAGLEGGGLVMNPNLDLLAAAPFIPSCPFVPSTVRLDPSSAQALYENQQLSAALLSAQAASLDVAAAQLREYARQAEEAAIRARSQVRSSVDPQISLEARVAAGKSIPSANRGTSRMWSSVEQINTEGNTTLMLKNVPNDYNRDMVLELLDENGFQGRYNFVYLPMDFKRWSGLGYAFVNMATHKDGVELMEKLNGFASWKKQSSKVCQVAWGDQGQGLDAHIQRYRNSPVMHPDWPEEARPLLFVDGERVDFPPPTKKLKPPRVRP